MTYGGGSKYKYPKTSYQKRVNALIEEHDEKLKKEYTDYLKRKDK